MYEWPNYNWCYQKVKSSKVISFLTIWHPKWAKKCVDLHKLITTYQIKALSQYGSSWRSWMHTRLAHVMPKKHNFHSWYDMCAACSVKCAACNVQCEVPVGDSIRLDSIRLDLSFCGQPRRSEKQSRGLCPVICCSMWVRDCIWGCSCQLDITDRGELIDLF